MKQNKQMYEAPKVELIEMETQGVLCASASGPDQFNGTGLQFRRAWGQTNWNVE